MTTWKIGKATFEVAEREIAYEGKPIGEDDVAVGALTTYKVSTTDLSTIIFGVVTWPNGVSEAIPVDVLKDSEQKYTRLQNAGRTIISNEGESWVAELNAMKHNPERGRSNLASASLEELSSFAERNIRDALNEFGNISIDTKEKLTGETNKNRNRLALKCEIGNKNAIAAAYVVTRVLATLKDFGM